MVFVVGHQQFLLQGGMMTSRKRKSSSLYRVDYSWPPHDHNIVFVVGYQQFLVKVGRITSNLVSRWKDHGKLNIEDEFQMTTPDHSFLSIIINDNTEFKTLSPGLRWEIFTTELYYEYFSISSSLEWTRFSFSGGYLTLLYQKLLMSYYKNHLVVLGWSEVVAG